MLQQLKYVCGYIVVIGLAILMAMMFMACTFNPSGIAGNPAERLHTILNMAPYVEITRSDRWIASDVPGKFHVQHGYSCAEAPHAASQQYIGLRIRESVVFPSRAYEGTVFLNGWDA
jgi:hypothetical protein